MKHELFKIKEFNIEIFQSNNFFKLSTESKLLVTFLEIKKSAKHILDLGTNNGAMALMLSRQTKAAIDGIEINIKALTIAKLNISHNKKEDQIKLINDNFLTYSFQYEYDYIYCNPPFYDENNVIKTKKENLNLVLYSSSLPLDQMLKKCSLILKHKGILCLVFIVDRFFELITLAKNYHLEPKTVCFIHHDRDKKANLFLISLQKNANKSLIILPPKILIN